MLAQDRNGSEITRVAMTWQRITAPQHANCLLPPNLARCLCTTVHESTADVRFTIPVIIIT